MASTGSPFAFFPLVVAVRVLPSADTTMVVVEVGFPSCLLLIRSVLALTRVSATALPYGLVPVIG